MSVTMVTPGPITVFDETTERADLAKRCEVKYAFTDADVGKLREHLAGNCRRMVHNGRVSVVRSIYFDDSQFSACRANIEGIGSRRKLRLRWYDSLIPEQLAFLEIKWRENRVTGKHRLKLTSPVPFGRFQYAALTEQLHHIVPEHFRCAMLRSPEPSVLVQYDREHFSSPDGTVRLTLDYNLTFYDQTGRTSLNTEFPNRLHDLVVIEGKVPVGQEAELRKHLHPFVPRANRCSKYVHGCRELCHIRFAE